MTTTPNRGYSRIGFGPDGWVSQDLSTFNLNLEKIDGDVHALFAALSGKRDADANIGMDKVTGLNDALTSKAAAGHSHQLTDLSDVDAAQAGEGYLLARQAGAWVPVSVNAVFGQFSVNINSVDGLADALNGKAASDHNHDADYLGKTETAANASRLGNKLPEYYAPASPATGYTGIIISDWDSVFENGIFKGENALNAPGPGWFIGEVFQAYTGWVAQRVWDFIDSRKVYVRFKIGGIWSSWTQVTGADHKVFHPDNVHANFDLTNGLFGGKAPNDLGAPAGTIIAFAATTTPSGYLTCYGQTVSRTTYAALFAAIGTRYGAGDGSTTFKVPDLRGEFLRGWDDGRGADPGRTFGGWQSASVGPHSHTVQGAGTGAQYDYNQYASGSTSVQTQTTSTTGSGIGSETRPRNVAVHFCIKY